MRFFLTYLKSRRGILGLFFLFAGIYFGVFALCRLPLAAAVYPSGLCLGIGLIVLLLDYGRVSRLHRMLQTIRSMTDAVTMTLPEPETVPEADHQTILRLLCQEQRRQTEEMNLRYQDMMDYYTVWAHQIKTPIASMGLHLQNEDSPLARQLSSDLTRISQYVDMVLAYLRLDSDSTDYVIRECELDGIIRRSVRKFAGEFIARRLKLIYEPLRTRVITDEKWLSFVVEQVLSNALKYTPSGSITIYLEKPGRCVSGIRASALRRRICPGSLKRATPASTGAAIRRPAALDCTCAGGSAGIWGIPSGRIPYRRRALSSAST